MMSSGMVLTTLSLIMMTGCAKQSGSEHRPSHLLIDAAKRGDVKLVKHYLSKGADVNANDARSEVGWTAIHLSAYDGFDDLMKVLLDSGGDANLVIPSPDALKKGDYTEKQGTTPLHLAAHQNRLSTVKLMLSHGASIDAQDHGGNTPLHLASSVTLEEHADMVELLLAEGADVNIQTKEGRNAWHLASSAKVKSMLLAAMDKPTQKTEL